MPNIKTIAIELESENPNGNGYFYSRLDLPANPAEIEDAMQEARFYQGENRYTGIHVIELPICPEIAMKQFDTASIQEYNALAKELVLLDEGYQKAVFTALATKLYPTDDDALVTVRDLIYVAQSINDFAVAANVRNDEELGELVLEYDMNDKIVEIYDEEILDMLSRRAIGAYQRQLDEGVYVDDFYVMTKGFHVPEEFEMPEAEEEPYAPIYVKLGAFVDMDGSEPYAAWFGLPISEEDKPMIAKQIRAVDFGYAEVFDLRSGIPYVNTDILAGGDLDDLNQLAEMYLKMNDMQKVTLKAAIETAQPRFMSDIIDIANHVDEYQLSYFSADEGDFFRNYISHHVDSKFDCRWLDSILVRNEGRDLINTLNASMTDYGVVSERGGLLFEAVPYGGDMSMGPENSADEYDLIEVCGQKGLYVDNRQDAMKVPEGCYRYDFRSGDEDDLATLEKDVLVDYSGSVFVKEPIEIPDEGYIALDEESSPNFLCEVMTIEEFAHADLSQLDEEEGMGGIT